MTYLDKPYIDAWGFQSWIGVVMKEITEEKYNSLTDEQKEMCRVEE